jgi:small conductance mechanosensitive channel
MPPGSVPDLAPSVLENGSPGMQDAIPYEQIENALLDAAIPIVLAVVSALLVLRFARPLIRRILRRMLQSEPFSASATHMTAADVVKRVDTLETLGVSAMRFVVVVLVVALVLAALNLGWVVGALGFVFAALAFAGQDFVRDYLAGIFILVENQFYVGDVVRLAQVTGTVEDFTLRRTTLRDADGTLHIVSNGLIRVASNLTRGYAGINLDVPIAYDADVDTAMAIIGDVGKTLAADKVWSERILEAPNAVRVDSFGDMGMAIKVLGRVRAGDQWAVTGELRRRVLAAFANAGINLPQRRIIIEQPGI